MTSDFGLQTSDFSLSPHRIVIEPSPGWRLIDVRELWRYRDLLWFLVWRDVKSRYAQSILFST